MPKTGILALNKEELQNSLARAKARMASVKAQTEKVGERMTEALAVNGGCATAGALMGMADPDGKFRSSDGATEVDGRAVIGGAGLLIALPAMFDMFGKQSEFLCSYGNAMTGFVVGGAVEKIVREKRSK